MKERVPQIPWLWFSWENYNPKENFDRQIFFKMFWEGYCSVMFLNGGLYLQSILKSTEKWSGTVWMMSLSPPFKVLYFLLGKSLLNTSIITIEQCCCRKCIVGSLTAYIVKNNTKERMALKQATGVRSSSIIVSSYHGFVNTLKVCDVLLTK